MNKKQSIVAGVFVGLLGAGLILNPNLKSDKKEIKADLNEVNTHIDLDGVDIGKPSAFKMDYMEGCLEDGSVTYEYCECTYDELDKEIGESGIAKMGMIYIEDGVEGLMEDQLYFNTIMSCLDEL